MSKVELEILREVNLFVSNLDGLNCVYAPQYYNQLDAVLIMMQKDEYKIELALGEGKQGVKINRVLKGSGVESECKFVSGTKAKDIIVALSEVIMVAEEDIKERLIEELNEGTTIFGDRVEGSVSFLVKHPLVENGTIDKVEY